MMKRLAMGLKMARDNIKLEFMMMIRDIVTGRIDEQFIKRFIFLNWLIGGIMVFVLFFAAKKLAIGMAIGAIIANLNCIGLARDCMKVIRWRNIFVYYAGLAVRLGLIALAVTAAFLMFPAYVSPVGLFLGLSVAIINFYIMVIVMVINRVRL
ncbi:MAG: ATP synthase subunit I [Dissulfurimicrobium sp.]|uniref:ATP synthase subunit I n=2 Tax=Dissulfurimicrobium sp. TaxID=2022436 RepID=UPI00404AE6F8